MGCVSVSNETSRNIGLPWACTETYLPWHLKGHIIISTSEYIIALPVGKEMSLYLHLARISLRRNNVAMYGILSEEESGNISKGHLVIAFLQHSISR